MGTGFDGTTFSVGTGFSDAERENPPPVGSFITYRYQELSDGGVLRFPSYVGIRADSIPSPATRKGDVPRRTSTPTVRQFEFSESGSNKFWEISVQANDVTVRYGRIGSQGQTNVKSFPDDAAAAKQAAKLIAEKTGRGYVEIL